MNLKQYFSAVVSTSIALTAVWSGQTTGAPDQIEIDAASCIDKVGLTTTDAMLSDVLRALAVELQFELHFKSDHDRPVSVTLRQPAQELIETLGKDDNIMISGEVDTRCDEPVDRLMAVWFLGTGPEIAYQPVSAVPLNRLPETGEEQARASNRSRSAQSTDKDNKQETKQKRDMTPEERYNEKLRRKAEKGKL